MIKDLMGKMHLQDAQKSSESERENMSNGMSMQEETKAKVPEPPTPPKPPVANSFQQEKRENYHENSQGNVGNINKEVTKMENEEGIVIDLGDGISLNVPIKKRMTLEEFLKVAEKVKALEMLSEENQKY